MPPLRRFAVQRPPADGSRRGDHRGGRAFDSPSAAARNGRHGRRARGARARGPRRAQTSRARGVGAVRDVLEVAPRAAERGGGVCARRRGAVDVRHLRAPAREQMRRAPGAPGRRHRRARRAGGQVSVLRRRRPGPAGGDTGGEGRRGRRRGGRRGGGGGGGGGGGRGGLGLGRLGPPSRGRASRRLDRPRGVRADSRRIGARGGGRRRRRRQKRGRRRRRPRF